MLLWFIVYGFAVVEAPGHFILIYAGFVALVGMSQAVLFKGRYPRLSSSLAGGLCLVVLILIDWIQNRLVVGPAYTIDLAAVLLPFFSVWFWDILLEFCRMCFLVFGSTAFFVEPYNQKRSCLC